MRLVLLIIVLLLTVSCHQPSTTVDHLLIERPGIRDTTYAENSATDSFINTIQAKERASVNNKEITDSLGVLVSTISFNVKTNELKDYPDGLIPFASIEKADRDIPNLANKDKVVIHDSAIQIIIDYPLNKPCTFRLQSANGFTTASLLKAISKQYYLIYEEEEKTATIKTLPMKKRKIFNRNETNGKYGIWGHDIADLVLDEALVYRNDKGVVTLTLTLES